MPLKKKIIVAMTGASGMIYASRFLSKISSEQFQEQISDVALVTSENVKGIWNNEIEDERISDFGFKIYKNNNFYVPFASGSSAYDVMVIIPCSMGAFGASSMLPSVFQCAPSSQRSAHSQGVSLWDHAGW